MRLAQGNTAIDSITIGKRHRKDLGDIGSLAASIRDVGLLHLPVIKPDGTLIAGERRIRACESLGWTRVEVRIVDLDNVARGELAENVEREPFLPSEIEAIRRTLEPIEKAAAKQRMSEGGKVGKLSLPSDAGKTADKIGAFAGISGRTVEKIAAVVAAAEAEPEKYGRLAEAMDRTGRVDGPYRRMKNAQQAEALRAEPPPLPGRGPYRVGQIDIPWAYEPDDENAPKRGVLPYSTLSIEQACALDVGAIMHTDSILWMWVTNFILARGLHLPVLGAWGFEPKTVITWPKDRFGQGHWVHGQTEHLVMAVRGKPVHTLIDQSTWLKGPFALVRKGAHSAKPKEAYSYIETLCPAARYADVFSRYRHNDRWDCHGDEAPSGGTKLAAPEEGRDTELRYVPHADVEQFTAEGWTATEGLTGTHHGEYSVLMHRLAPG